MHFSYNTEVEFLSYVYPYLYFFSILSVLAFWRRTLSSKPENQEHFFLSLFFLFDPDQSSLTYCPSSPTYTLFSRGQWGEGKEKKKKKLKFLEIKKGEKMQKLRADWIKEYQRHIFMGESLRKKNYTRNDEQLQSELISHSQWVLTLPVGAQRVFLSSLGIFTDHSLIGPI